MPKVRYRRLKAVQAELEAMLEATERMERQGRHSAEHDREIARLEARERELLRRIREGADSENAAARYQRAKTHCPSGHPYDADNLFLDHRGHRMCRACKRKYDLERWRRLNPPKKKKKKKKKEKV